MTRKHFKQAAIEFGYVYRETVEPFAVEAEQIGAQGLDSSKSWAQYHAARIAWEAMVNAFCSVAKTENSNFDKARFVEFTKDVAHRVRDLDGNKVAA